MSTFGRCALDARTRTLTRNGVRVEIQQQPMELLLLLVSAADQTVTRDAIRARIWPDVVVDYDRSINYAVRQVRIALGEEAWRLQTVPRRGYRFVGPVIAPRAAVQRTRTDVSRAWPRAVAVAALAAVLATVFGAGIVTAHTESGAFIYEHLVHPDHCPYVRMLMPGRRS